MQIKLSLCGKRFGQYQVSAQPTVCEYWTDVISAVKYFFEPKANFHCWWTWKNLVAKICTMDNAGLDGAIFRILLAVVRFQRIHNEVRTNVLLLDKGLFHKNQMTLATKCSIWPLSMLGQSIWSTACHPPLLGYSDLFYKARPHIHNCLYKIT